MQIIEQPVELDGIAGTTTVYDYGKGIKLVAAYKVVKGSIVASKNQVRLEFVNPELVIPQVDVNIKYATELMRMFSKLEVDYLASEYSQVFYDFVNSYQFHKYLTTTATVDLNVKKLLKALSVMPLGNPVEIKITVRSRDLQTMVKEIVPLAYIRHPYFAAIPTSYYTKRVDDKAGYNVTHIPSGLKLSLPDLSWAKWFEAVDEIIKLPIDFSKTVAPPIEGVDNTGKPILTTDEIKSIQRLCGELSEKFGKKKN